MTEVLSIILNKGGTGKSTLTTNLSALLADRGHKVLLIDLDPQGNSSLAFGENPETFDNTLYDVLLSDVNPEKVVVTVNENLDILPSSSDSDLFELNYFTEWNKRDNPFILLRDKLQDFIKNYDYVLIDTAPSFSTLTINSLGISTGIIVPFEASLFSSKGLIRLVNSIDKFRESLNPDLKILGVVPIMIDRRTNVNKESIRQAKNYLEKRDIRMFDTEINRSIVFTDSVFYNSKPAVWVEPNHKEVKKYRTLLDEILNEIEKD